MNFSTLILCLALLLGIAATTADATRIKGRSSIDKETSIRGRKLDSCGGKGGKKGKKSKKGKKGKKDCKKVVQKPFQVGGGGRNLEATWTDDYEYGDFEDYVEQTIYSDCEQDAVPELCENTDGFYTCADAEFCCAYEFGADADTLEPTYYGRCLLPVVEV